MSKLAKKIKNSWNSALATLIYPLEGFLVQCPDSSKYHRPLVDRVRLEKTQASLKLSG